MMTLNHYIADKKIKFGALKGPGTTTSTQKSQIVRDTLRLKWIRSRIILSDITNPNTWNGANIIDANIALGLKQVLVVVANETGQGPQPWPTDIPLLEDRLERIYEVYGNIFPVVVVDNEEMNQNYHNGTDAEYINFVNTVADVYHKYNIKVTNGGFGDNLTISMNVYRWVLAKYGQAEATIYGRCMFQRQETAARNPGSRPDLDAEGARSVNILSNSDIDYVNFHGYEPFDRRSANPQTLTSVTPKIWRYKKEYAEDTFKIPLLSNELGQGQDNDIPAMTVSILNELYRLGFDYAQWWDGTGDTGARSKPLTQDNSYPGVLTPTGVAFRDWILTHQ